MQEVLEQKHPMESGIPCNLFQKFLLHRSFFLRQISVLAVLSVLSLGPAFAQFMISLLETTMELTSLRHNLLHLQCVSVMLPLEHLALRRAVYISVFHSLSDVSSPSVK